MGKYSSGFTLIELVIIVLILGIISAVAIPAMNNGLNEMKLDAAAREVVSAIQYAQSLSIKEGHSHGVKVSKVDDQLECYEFAGNQTVRHPIDKKLYILDFSVAGHLQGVDVFDSDFTGNKILFNALGEPEEAGSVILAYGGSQKTINVSIPIGKVSVN